QTLAGNIHGTGTVRKQGSGVLTVNGRVSPEFTLAGGVLAGTGILDKVTLNSGTAVAPGGKGSIGTLSMRGDSISFSGVSYLLDLGPNNSSDQIQVEGEARLTGGKIDIASWLNGAYTIISATSLSGTINAADITVRGAAPGSRQNIGLGISHDEQGGQGGQGGQAKLVLTLSESALALLWNGSAGNTWNSDVAANTVWKREDDGRASYFINDDSASFGPTGAGSVSVDPGGVTVGSMRVTADGYNFSGGAIASNGALHLAATSPAGTVFSNDINFRSGISLASGHTLEFDYDSGAHNNNNLITGAGGLTKSGTGSLTLSGDLDYSGATVVKGGLLVLSGKAAALSSSGISIASGGALEFNHDSGTLSYGNSISGAGKLQKTGAGRLSLTGDLALTGELNVSAGTLALTKTGAHSFVNRLLGSGNLAFDLGASGNALTFGSGVGGAFTGTVQLERGSLALDANAATGLTTASLQLDAEAGASLDLNRAIGGLTFNGGDLSFAGDALLSLASLSITAKGGTVTVDGAALDSVVISTSNFSFYDYASSDSNLYQKQLVATAAIDRKGSLALAGAANNGALRDILDGSDLVGKASFSYTVSVLDAGVSPPAGARGSGVYLGYGLTGLEALDGKTVVLDSSQSVSTKPGLSVPLTGQGGFAFVGDREVEVGNSNSNYRGKTTIDAGKVTMTTDNAFGSTSGLQLQNNASLNMNGMAQTVGGLTGDKESDIELGQLTVNQDTDSTFAGTLSGAGALVKQGDGTLILSGANTYSKGTTVSSGSLRLTDSRAAGAGGVTTGPVATLELAFDGSFANSVSGSGGLTADAGTGTLILAGTNSYTGMSTVKSGTLKLGSDLTSSKDLTLHGGTTFDSNGYAHSLKGGSLTVWQGGASYKGKLDATDSTLNFIVTDESTGPMLLVSGAADIDGSRVNLGVAGGTKLQPGTQLPLLQASGGLTGTAVQGDGKLSVGVTVVHDIALTHSNYSLQATVGKGGAAKGAKALSEGYLAGMGLTLQGADLASGQGMDAAVRAGTAHGRRLAGFGAASGAMMRYKTGSHIDMHSVSLITGLALGTDLAPGRLTLGAFFEYGNGSYDTYNSFSNAASVDGDGNTRYAGGGILARMDFADTGPGHVYAEASGRMGRVHNDYDSSDLRDARGRKADYDSSSLYYSLHFGAGYVWNITENASLDLYGKYFWTRQEGDSVGLSTGERVRFDDVDSHRLRAGSRFSYKVNEYISPYIGAAWEHEFDGKARAYTNGYRISAPDLEGDTGIGEIGFSLKPTMDLPLTFDLGVQGYVGQREGVTG
ncbi:autotransporter domain-containing protein, partial [Desulfovibrio sp. OttesenSCG-928-A18]|nr:autotransporter domain-containing protein [Desulfovibrio sp. OttesenSCG-928-A18]